MEILSDIEVEGLIDIEVTATLHPITLTLSTSDKLKEVRISKVELINLLV